MRRRAFVAGMAAVMTIPPGAQAQQPGRTYRIGILLPGVVPNVSPAREAFNQVLSELGFVVGQNLIAERLAAEGRMERLPIMANELVKRRVDVIVAVTTPAVRAAKHATSVIPIVMSSVADPVGDGFIASLAQPGGNITGVTDLGMDVSTKALELIRQLLPRANRLVMTLQRDNATARRMASRLQELAKPIGLKLYAVEVGDVSDLENSFGEILAERPDAIWFASVLLASTTAIERTVELTRRHQLPALYINPRAVEMGGLFSYAESDVMHWRRIGRYVGKILQGTKPADLPVEQPTHTHLAINLKTAKALGLTMPPSLLLRADQVIE